MNTVSKKRRGITLMVRPNEFRNFDYSRLIRDFDIYKGRPDFLRRARAETRIRFPFLTEGKRTSLGSRKVRGYCQLLISVWPAWPLYLCLDDNLSAASFLIALKDSTFDSESGLLRWDRKQALAAVYHSVPAVSIVSRRLNFASTLVNPTMQRLGNFVHHAANPFPVNA